MIDSFDLLNTTELNSEIEKMFRDERQFIFILSPYLNLADKLQAILNITEAKVSILHRETDENGSKKIDEFKKNVPKVEFYCIKNFHAKAYITSNTMIITSLNLYKQSQINNFELGIVLRGDLYNKVIGKLLEELQILFEMNHLDKKILDYLKPKDVYATETVGDSLAMQEPPPVYESSTAEEKLTVDILFKEILKRDNINEKDYPDQKILLLEFSRQMADKYTFNRNDYWKRDENILSRGTEITKDMYEWGLKNIKLQMDVIPSVK